MLYPLIGLKVYKCEVLLKKQHPQADKQFHTQHFPIESIILNYLE